MKWVSKEKKLYFVKQRQNETTIVTLSLQVASRQRCTQWRFSCHIVFIRVIVVSLTHYHFSVQKQVGILYLYSLLFFERVRLRSVLSFWLTAWLHILLIGKFIFQRPIRVQHLFTSERRALLQCILLNVPMNLLHLLTPIWP